MKKTLAAVAVLGAFAGSALAADVTLYGKVDLGVHYTHADKDGAKTDNWALDSGISSASRFGFKGSEQISEGLTVGFQLEHGFDADDGEDNEGLAFRREARLYVATDYGTLHFGRFGALDAATGSVDVAAGLTASGTGYGGIVDQSTVFHTNGRLNNSVAYTSPKFAGVTVSAMASLGDAYTEKDDLGHVLENGKTGKEASHDVDRYYGVAVKGQWGALGAGLVVSQLDVGAVESAKAEDDALNVTAGVNYDFGVTKVFLAGNYYDQGKVDATEVKTYGVSLSAATPLAGGTLETAVAYGVAKDDLAQAGEDEEKTLDVGAFYKYPLSKRTYVYAGAGYTQVDYDDGGDKDKTINVISGICHSF